MFASAIAHLKKNLRNLKSALTVDPLFSRYDKYQLNRVNRKTNTKKLIRLKPKGLQQPIIIRKNYTDKEVVFYVLQDQYHLPPKSSKLSNNPVILDLGSNIGLTIAHMKHVYPSAKIIGYEMNTENYLLAQKNTESYSNVTIHNNAVWVDDTYVTYLRDMNYDSYTIIKDKSEVNSDDLINVQAIKLDSIIKNNKLQYIDYLKMDIEGAEKEILESSDLNWMDMVQAMNIEMHLTKETDIYKYIKIIESKGFYAWKDDKHWSSVFAVRK